MGWNFSKRERPNLGTFDMVAVLDGCLRSCLAFSFTMTWVVHLTIEYIIHYAISKNTRKINTTQPMNAAGSGSHSDWIACMGWNFSKRARAPPLGHIWHGCSTGWLFEVLFGLFFHAENSVILHEQFDLRCLNRSSTSLGVVLQLRSQGKVLKVRKYCKQIGTP